MGESGVILNAPLMHQKHIGLYQIKQKTPLLQWRFVFSKAVITRITFRFNQLMLIRYRQQPLSLAPRQHLAPWHALIRSYEDLTLNQPYWQLAPP